MRLIRNVTLGVALATAAAGHARAELDYRGFTKEQFVFMAANVAGSAPKCGWATEDEARMTFAAILYAAKLDKKTWTRMAAIYVNRGCPYTSASANYEAKKIYLKMKGAADGVRGMSSKSSSESSKSSSDNAILNSCRQKWGGDYEMIEYCYKKQTGARDRMGLD